MGTNAHNAASRRQVLAGIAAFSGAALTAPFSLKSAMAADSAAPGSIDFHHHFNPTFLRATAGKGGGGLNWDISYSLEDMDKSGIATAILSPPTGFADRMDAEHRAALVRQVNDAGAQLVHDHRGRYRQFVYLPLPDIDTSLKEIEYGFGTLNTVGAGFATSYGNIYVSDPMFAPIWEELNRRKAIAYFHPLAGACCTALMPTVPQEGQLVEIPYDTGRAVVGFLLSGAFAKYRDIKFVFSHSGGAVPMFAGRFKRLLETADLSKVAPDGIDAEFRRLYYETANAASPPSMAALLKFAPLSQVLFGSDHPYVSDVDNMEDLRDSMLSPAQRDAILRGNATRLIPSLRA